MGFFDFDTGSVISHKSSHSRRHSSKKHGSSSKHRSRSRSSTRSKRHSGTPSIAASLFGGDDYKKHSASRSSFFGIPSASRSSGSFFGLGGRSPSYYKRSPRGGFVQKTLKQVKRLWRDLVYYAKKHPYKVLALVIMPLITGGFLTALLARFGLRLPPAVERMIGIGAKAAQGDSVGLVGEAVRMATTGLGAKGTGSVNIERGYGDGVQWERRTVEREGGGWGDGLVNGIAKMFV